MRNLVCRSKYDEIEQPIGRTTPRIINSKPLESLFGLGFTMNDCYVSNNIGQKPVKIHPGITVKCGDCLPQFELERVPLFLVNGN